MDFLSQRSERRFQSPMYAPIVLRFNTYGIVVGDTEKDYMNTILSLSTLKDWVAESFTEKEILAGFEIET